jgi:hypothetical protein
MASCALQFCAKDLSTVILPFVFLTWHFGIRRSQTTASGLPVNQSKPFQNKRWYKGEVGPRLLNALEITVIRKGERAGSWDAVNVCPVSGLKLPRRLWQRVGE